MRLSRRVLLASGLAGVAGLMRARHASGAAPLRAVYHHDIPPYSYQDAAGRDPAETSARGILIDLLDIVGEASGYRLSHQGFPWARAQRMVELGIADALCCPPTVERSRYALFAPTPVTILAEGEHFFAIHSPHAADIRAARRKEDLYAFAIVAFRGNSSNAETWADHPRRYEADEIEQLFQMLLRGRADFYSADPTVTRFKLKQLGLLDKFGSAPAGYVDGGRPIQMHFGLRRSYPDAAAVVAIIDAAIKSAITPQRHQSVMARYTT